MISMVVYARFPNCCLMRYPFTTQSLFMFSGVTNFKCLMKVDTTAFQESSCQVTKIREITESKFTLQINENKLRKRFSVGYLKKII